MQFFRSHPFFLPFSIVKLIGKHTPPVVSVCKIMDCKITLNRRFAERSFLRSGDIWGELMEGIMLFALSWSCFPR